MKKLLALITVLAIAFCLFTITTNAQTQTYEYFKSQLNADEQKIYAAFLDAAASPAGESAVPVLSTIQYEFTAQNSINSQEQLNSFIQNDTACKTSLTNLNNYFKNAIAAAANDHPEYYWLLNSQLAKLSYGYSSYGKNVKIVDVVINIPQPVANAKQSIDNFYNKIKSIGATGSDLQKIKTIHDWLCNNVVYVESTNSHNAYGALFEGKSVCEGYAKAFKAACDYFGIKCVCVEGDAINTKGVPESHMWNYVLVNNTWYAIDVTWNDQNSGIYDDYYLVGADTVATHFDNLPFKNSHLPDGKIGATAQKVFNYPSLSKNGYSISNPTQAPTKAPTPIPTNKPTKTNTPINTPTNQPGQPNQNTPQSTHGITVTQAPVENNITPTPTEQTGNNVTPTIENTMQATLEPTEDNSIDKQGINKPKSTIIIISASAVGIITVAAIIAIIIRKKR